MSPEKIFEGWQHQKATLLKTDVRGTDYEAVDVHEAASRAKELLDIEATDEDAYIVPLFEIDEPKPSNDYVYFRPGQGQIGWFDAGFGVSGVERFATCEKLETNEIGHRLRHWLPSNHPDLSVDVDESELPTESVAPTDRLSTAQEESFFDHLKGFVRSEREAEKETNWENYADIGLQEAIRRNRVSGPFIHLSQTKGNDGQPAFRYQIASDEEDDDIDLRADEGLFNGNRCILDVEDSEEHFPIEVELLSVDDPAVKFQPVWGEIEDRTVVQKLLDSDGEEIWFHELLNPVPFERRLSAIREVRENEKKRELLTGKRNVGFTVNKYALPKGAIELNEYQRQALIWADSADDVVCIHGPPGTGKTRTLTAYVAEAVSRGQSVLVTAHSNQAVDNLLVGESAPGSPEEDTLHAMAQDPDNDLTIGRVGSNSRNRVVQDHYMDRSAKRVDVVAATTSGAAQFDQNEFDVAVVDEATQASRPATAIALNSARKLVLAGDHKQLPPYCADETMQEEDLHISLFEYLLDRYGDGISILLRKQYRMNEEIAEFPNTAFYDGTLETAEGNREWTVEDLKPIVGIDIVGDERRQTHGNSFYNPTEAEAAAKQVRLLIESGLDTEDIGVISAYSGQKRQIQRAIGEIGIEYSHRVTVDTVDSFQGGEREAIIVSFVRSNQDGHSGFLEFPEEGPRRLNVAITRARKRLVLIGDWETLGTIAPHRTTGDSCAPLYAELADHLQSKERMLTEEPR